MISNWSMEDISEVSRALQDQNTRKQYIWGTLKVPLYTHVFVSKTSVICSSPILPIILQSSFIQSVCLLIWNGNQMQCLVARKHIRWIKVVVESFVELHKSLIDLFASWAVLFFCSFACSLFLLLLVPVSAPGIPNRMYGDGMEPGTGTGFPEAAAPCLSVFKRHLDAFSNML